MNRTFCMKAAAIVIGIQISIARGLSGCHYRQGGIILRGGGGGGHARIR
jgi:hypothetical protein